jgi:hypothetical protein
LYSGSVPGTNHPQDLLLQPIHTNKQKLHQHIILGKKIGTASGSLSGALHVDRKPPLAWVKMPGQSVAGRTYNARATMMGSIQGCRAEITNLGLV